MAPKQKPGKSKQDYGTPADFLAAVRAKFGDLDVDLACDAKNQKAPIGLYPEMDSLEVDWLRFGGVRHDDENLWLNPPFASIAPWAAKCAEVGPWMKKGRIIVLVPASMGTNWWGASVVGKADRIGLSPRLVFDGTPVNPKTGKSDGYPKDLALLVYSAESAITGGCDGFWRWKE